MNMGVIPRRTSDDQFRSFYERLEPRAVSAATRLVHDRGLGEDIAAEAFARAYAQWGRVLRHPNPDAWLLRVVGNVAIDQIRRESRRGDLEATSTNHRREGNHSDPVAERSELRLDIRDAIGRLSGRQQEVVVMRYLIDLSEDDVAAGLGMSTGSVKTHLSRASKKLRIDLSEDHHGSDDYATTNTQ